MRIKDWLPGFIERHVGRHPRGDWPDAAEMRAAWLRGFMMLEPRPRADEADAASVRLVGRRLEFPQDHLFALIEEIGEARMRPTDGARRPTPAAPVAVERPVAEDELEAAAEMRARFGWGRGWRELAALLAERDGLDLRSGGVRKAPRVAIPEGLEDDPIIAAHRRAGRAEAAR